MIEYINLIEDNLEAVRELSNRNLEFDPINPDLFRHLTLDDPDFDPALSVVAMQDDKSCGYILGICRKTDDGVSGGIKLLAVDKEFRNQGIATEMLSRIEQQAKIRGALALRVGFTRPNYLTAGLDPRYTLAAAFFTRRGYNRRSDAYNMDVDLAVSDWSTSAIESKLSAQNIVCRRLGKDEKQRLHDWMEKDGFSTGWRYQVMHAADQDPVAVFIAEQDGEIIAFACYDGVRPGWFGPMGTTQNLRGGGVGTVTFLKCLQSMKEVGYKVCEINSVGPLYFYSKVANAKVSRIFWQFEKKFE